MNLGDYRVGDTIDFHFTTRSFATGAPTTLAGSPSVAAYPGNSTTEITAGITLTVDFDARTGLHQVRIVATGGNGYSAGQYDMVITAGTVGGVSVVGEVVARFTLEATSVLRPTVGGRTLDVTAGGEAGIDLDNTVGTLAKTTDITGFNDLSAAQVNAECDTALADYDAPTNAEMVARTLLAADYFDPAADQVIVATNNDKTGYSISGTKTTLDALNDLSAAAVNAEVDAALDTAIPVSPTADSINERVKRLEEDVTPTRAGNLDNLDAAVTTRATPAQVNSEVDTALQDIHLDHAFAVDYDPAAKPGVATALFNELIENDGAGVSRYTAGALSQAPTGGSAPTAGEIADAVWDEAKAGHVGVGSFGEEVQAHALTSEVAAVENDTQDIQNRLPAALVGGRMDSDIGAKTGNVPLSAQEKLDVNAEADTAIQDAHLDHLLAVDYDPAAKPGVATALLNELIENDGAGVSRYTAGALAQAPAGGGGGPTAGDIADAVWDEARADHVAAGSFGQGVPVQNLGTTARAEVNAECDTALADYDAPTKAEMDAALAALNDVSTAEVLTQVNAALDAAIAELPIAEPPDTPSLRQAVMFRYMQERNKRKTTANLDEVHNAAGQRVAKATVSGTPTAVTREKFGSGA